MYTAEDFKQAYADYIAYNQKLNQNIGMMSGIMKVFGFKTGPGDDACHQEFYNEMKSALEEVCEDKPDPEAAGEIMDVIFGAKVLYADGPVSPYMFAAIEGLTKDLIPFLTAEKAAQIYKLFLDTTPRKMRVPIHKEILASLKTTAGIE